MKLLCKLFGHKWVFLGLVCKRCGIAWWDSDESNRTDLDESRGSLEKWLDKHMD